MVYKILVEAVMKSYINKLKTNMNINHKNKELKKSKTNKSKTFISIFKNINISQKTILSKHIRNKNIVKGLCKD